MDSGVLGFVGLGRMGGPMAHRLIDAGHVLHVFDARAEAMAPLADRGARTAGGPDAVAAAAEVVFTCLPTPEVVRAVALDAGGLIDGSAMRALVDMSTTGPVMARRIAAGLAARGITLVDAPVTGGIAGAEAGTLTVMVSCPRLTLARVEPILAHLGRVVYTGEAPGLAQTAKLANNLLSAAALAVTAEAMAMGTRAGIEPRVLLDIINAGSGRNSASEDKFPRAVLTGTFDFGITTGLFLKDLRLCLDAAESLGVPMVVGAAVRELFAISQARFGEAADFTSVARVLEEWARIERTERAEGA